VPEGSTLLDAAIAADVHINAQEKEKSYVLACQTKVLGDVTVKIPEETIARKLKVAGMGKEATDRFKGLVKDIQPMLIEIPLELEYSGRFVQRSGPAQPWIEKNRLL